MSRLIFAFAAVVAAAAFAVPAVLAEKGNRDTDTIFQEQFERMRRETQDLRERFRGRFENRGRPIDRVRRGTLAGRAIAVGDVSAVSAFSITVGEKTFVVTDETQIPDDLEVGDFVVVRGKSTDGELVASRVHRPGILRGLRGAFRIRGTVEELTYSSIKVAGEDARLIPSTHRPDDLAVGDEVAVVGTVDGDGDRIARAVLSKRTRETSGFRITDERFQGGGEVKSVVVGPGYVKLEFEEQVVRIAPLQVESYEQRGELRAGSVARVRGTVTSGGELLATFVSVRGR